MNTYIFHKIQNDNVLDFTTELYNSVEGTWMSLPLLIVDGSSGRRNVPLIKIFVYLFLYTFIVLKYLAKI